MRHLHLWTCCLGVALLAASALGASEAPFVAPGVETHRIESKFVDQTFEIYVQVPIHRAGGDERFPVLYLTDSYGDLAFRSTTSMMQFGGDVPRFIAVGIGYADAHPLSALQIRTRDLTPVASPDEAPSLSALVQGVPALELDKTSGGAADFLRFLREELQPFIDANYPTDPSDRGYWGDSLGGLFGLYVLFNQPDTFDRYIIGSPSIWWADRAIVADAKAFLEKTKALDARIFFGVGSLEERGAEAASAAMVTNMFELEAMLRAADIDGLQISSYLFPNETHTSVLAMNYIRGIQAVYGRPELPLFQQLMQPPETEN